MIVHGSYVSTLDDVPIYPDWIRLPFWGAQYYATMLGGQVYAFANNHLPTHVYCITTQRAPKPFGPTRRLNQSTWNTCFLLSRGSLVEQMEQVPIRLMELAL